MGKPNMKSYIQIVQEKDLNYLVESPFSLDLKSFKNKSKIFLRNVIIRFVVEKPTLWYSTDLFVIVRITHTNLVQNCQSPSVAVTQQCIAHEPEVTVFLIVK